MSHRLHDSISDEQGRHQRFDSTDKQGGWLPKAKNLTFDDVYMLVPAAAVG
jgi:hypothetical protein